MGWWWGITCEGSEVRNLTLHRRTNALSAQAMVKLDSKVLIVEIVGPLHTIFCSNVRKLIRAVVLGVMLR